MIASISYLVVGIGVVGDAGDETEDDGSVVSPRSSVGSPGSD